MSEVAGFASAMPPLRPPDFGAADPGGADGAAFAALFASLGYPTLQNPAQQALLPPASIGRQGGGNGNVVPLRALDFSGAIARQLFGDRLAAAPAETVSAPGAQRIDGLAALSSERLNGDPAFDNRDLAARSPFDLFAQRTKFGPDPVTMQALPQSDLAEDLLAQTQAARTTSPTPDVPVLGSTASAATPGGAIPTVTAEAPVPLHHARFTDAFTHQVTVLARDGIQHARISINPPELGPVELRIVVRNDEASVQLAASHAAVRDVLEQALPRLREQFEQAGMQLSDSSVYAQLPGGTSGQSHGSDDMAAAYGAEPGSALDVPASPAGPARIGLVDTYI